MGHLRKRGSGWELRVGAGGRYFTRTFHGSERAARKALRAFELHMGQGVDDGDTTTVADLLEMFILAADLSPTTLYEYRRAQAAIPDQFAKRSIWKVRAPDLDVLYRTLTRDRVNVHTVRRIHDVLSAAFSKAVGWGWLDRNPAEHATPPPRPRSERSAANPVDVAKLIQVCPPKLKLWLRLAFVTGSRRGELCALKWRDIDLSAGTIVIRRNVVYAPGGGLTVKDTKEGVVKVVPIDAGTVAMLEEHREAEARIDGTQPARPSPDPVGSYGRLGHHRQTAEPRPPSRGARSISGATGSPHTLSDRWLFTHDPDGREPWRPDYVTLALNRLKPKAGVTFKIHEIRHATATELLDAGFAMSTVKEHLGHDREETTRNFYSHAVKARGQQAADHLGKLLNSM